MAVEGEEGEEERGGGEGEEERGRVVGSRRNKGGGRTNIK